MQKIFPYLFCLITILIEMGCACGGIGCRKDIKQQECMLDLFPYEPGDVLIFVNQFNDTLRFNCNKRSIFKTPQSQGSRVEEECCDTYYSEDFSCSFDKDNGYGLAILEYNNSAYSAVSIAVSLDTMKTYGIWYLGRNCGLWQYGENYDTKEIAGKNYFNVTTPENGDSTMYLNVVSLGFIGFKLVMSQKIVGG